MKLNIGILSSTKNGSPKVLAESLEHFIINCGENAKRFNNVKALRRLLRRNVTAYYKSIWYLYKAIHTFGDFLFFKKLKRMDAVILCDCTPNAFYKDSYDIKKLKEILHEKPILYYAVQYLGNAPTIIKKLENGGHPGIERYDWHLTVSDITEIKQKPSPPWSQVGIYLKSTGLKPLPKKDFYAIIDFTQPGNESYSKMQIESLEELGIPYVKFDKQYTLKKIRKFYQKGTIYFIQSFEAFGMPIAECLACGTYVMTADNSWPMSWRLDNNPQIHGPGILPDCFIIYHGKRDLIEKLKKLRDNYDMVKTPLKVFDSFYKNYPTFYDGNRGSMIDVISRIKNKNLN